MAMLFPPSRTPSARAPLHPPHSAGPAPVPASRPDERATVGAAVRVGERRRSAGARGSGAGLEPGDREPKGSTGLRCSRFFALRGVTTRDLAGRDRGDRGPGRGKGPGGPGSVQHVVERGWAGLEGLPEAASRVSSGGHAHQKWGAYGPRRWKRTPAPPRVRALGTRGERPRWSRIGPARSAVRLPRQPPFSSAGAARPPTWCWRWELTPRLTPGGLQTCGTANH